MIANHTNSKLPCLSLLPFLVMAATISCGTQEKKHVPSSTPKQDLGISRAEIDILMKSREGQLDSSQRTIEDLKLEAARVNEQNKELEKEKLEYENKLALISQQKSGLDVENEKINSQTDDLVLKSNESTEKIEKLEEEANQRDVKIAELTDQKFVFEQEKLQLNEQNANYKEMVAKIEVEKNKLDQEITGLKNDNLVSQKQMAKLNETLNSLIDKIQRKEQSLSNQQTDIQNLIAKLKSEIDLNGDKVLQVVKSVFSLGDIKQKIIETVMNCMALKQAISTEMLKEQGKQKEANEALKKSLNSEMANKLANYASKQDIKDFVSKTDIASLATKNEIKALATKEELKGLATREELKNLVSKSDMKDMATKEDLKGLATKNDIKDLATKTEIKDMATKNDIKDLATKTEIKDMATKGDLKDFITSTAMDAKFKAEVGKISEELKLYVKTADAKTMLEASTSALRSEIEKNYVQISGMQQQLEKLGLNVSSLTILANSQKQIMDVVNQFQSVKDQSSSNSEAIKALRNEVDTINKVTIEGINNRISGVDSRISGVDGRIEGVDSQVSSNTQSINALKSQVAAKTQPPQT